MHAGCWVWCWWCIIIPGDGTSLSLSEYWLDSAWRHWLQWVPLSWVITSGAQNLRLRPLCDTECDRWLHNNVILITPLWSACPQLPSPHFLQRAGCRASHSPQPMLCVIMHWTLSHCKYKCSDIFGMKDVFGGFGMNVLSCVQRLEACPEISPTLCQLNSAKIIC